MWSQRNLDEGASMTRFSPHRGTRGITVLTLLILILVAIGIVLALVYLRPAQRAQETPVRQGLHSPAPDRSISAAMVLPFQHSRTVSRAQYPSQSLSQRFGLPWHAPRRHAPLGAVLPNPSHRMS
jgi:hypothetical protein